MRHLLSLLISFLVGIYWTQSVEANIAKPTYLLQNKNRFYRQGTTWLGLPRRRRFGSYAVTNPFTQLDFFRSRPRFLVWSDENLKPWSEWRACQSRNCQTVRFRQCLPDRKCPADYLVETKKCTDAPGCSPDDFITTLKNFNETCGKRSTMNLKIFGGVESKPHSWPWQGGLFMKGKDELIPDCGATLIGDRWALTAAHCLAVSYWPKEMPLDVPFRPEQLSTTSLYVALGDHHVEKKEEAQKKHKVKNVVIHKEFHLSTGNCINDIALLEMEKPVKLNQHINIACLPPSDLFLRAGTVCKALGWGVFKRARGRTSFLDWFRPATMVRSNVLREVDLPLVPYDSCTDVYPANTLRRDRHLCAGKRGKDTCKGDSGGPLMCKVNVANGQSQWFLYGITSFGSPPRCGETFSVYTRVSHFVPWIKKMQKSMM